MTAPLGGFFAVAAGPDFEVDAAVAVRLGDSFQLAALVAKFVGLIGHFNLQLVVLPGSRRAIRVRCTYRRFLLLGD